MLELIEEVVGDVAFFGDALAEAGAVADDEELDFAAGAALVEPAGEGDLFADIVL